MPAIIKILAISGSLRYNSANVQVIQYMAGIAPAHIAFDIYDGLGNIPPFDDDDTPGEAVATWRSRISEADGIMICAPEYAFGVSGVLKNALDWTVSSGNFDGKPVSLITAATGGEKAHAALLLTLNVISGDNVVRDASLLIPYIRAKMNKDGELTDEATAKALQDVMTAFVSHLE